MATFIVTNAADSGAGSLRDAIAQANATSGADTIIFDAAVFNGEAADRIRLTTGTLLITEALTIDGGAAGVTITGDALGNDVVDAQGITSLAASQAAALLGDNTRVLDAGFAVALTLSRLTLTGGYTTDPSEGGGAVRAGTLTVTDSTFAGNGTGGAIAPGGAAYAAGDAAFTNVTLAGNATAGSVSNGGAAFSGGSLTLTNSTVTDNATASSLTLGGGLWGVSVTLANSIVLGNATTGPGAGGDEVTSFQPLVLQGGNIIGKGGGAADVFSGATDIGDTTASAVFAATTAGPGGSVAGVLAVNGGPVETVALRAGVNPAIDGGSGGTVTADARGVAAVDARDLGASGSGAAVRDLGAFEVATPAEAQSLVVTTAADVVDPFDGLTSLREAVAYANARGGVDTITFDQAVFNGEAADIIRLTGGTIRITDSLRIDGGPNGVLITGDRNGDDVTYAGGVTDVAASLIGSDRLDDNVRVFDAAGTELVVLQRLTITGGRTTGDNEFGGGVRGGFELRIIDAAIAGNSTTGDFSRGGGAASDFLRLTNATLVGNTTSGDGSAGGGAFANRLYAASSTVTGNSTSGVGVHRPYGPAGNTMFGAGYTYSADGGGLFGRDVLVTNSIVAGNTTLGEGVRLEDIGFYLSADFPAGSVYRGSVRNAYNPVTRYGQPVMVGFRGEGLLIDTGRAVSVDELRVPSTDKTYPLTSIFAETTTLANGIVAGVLADNGGPVRTVALRENNANPVLDRSNVGDTSQDARGITAADVPAVGRDGAGIRDLGAFEATVPPTNPLLVNTLADVVDAFDGVTSLREAVTYANLRPGDDTVTFDPTIFDGSPGAILRLTEGAIITVRTPSERFTLTIDGGPAGVTITGDRLGNDVTDADGITDVMASRAGTSRLSDNSRILQVDLENERFTSGPQEQIVLKNLTLTGGYATSKVNITAPTSAGGGAVAARYLTLIDSHVQGNATNGSGLPGGGIAAYDATLLRSTVTDNHTFGIFGAGGGIFSNRTVVVTDSIVSNNSTSGANADGGGLRGILVTIENSTISGNQATGAGSRAGGISESDGYSAVVGSTITGNSSAGAGGGILAGSSLTITNSIVLGNESTDAGVGGDNVAFRGSGGAPTLLGRNILGTDTGTANIFQGATDIGDTTAAAVFAQTLVLAGGAVAGVAADNGGPTETVALNPDPANPAIGGADPATAPDTDQRGAPRDAAPDLGAFEVTKPVAAADSLGTGREMGIFFNALANDTAAAGGIDVTTLRFVGADAGSDGRTLTVAGVGLWEAAPDVGFVTFTPAAGFQGIASVRYVVADLFGGVSDPAEIRVDVAPGARGTATAGNDRLVGSIYGDSMDGLGGNDSIRGLDGFDILKGGDGNDTIDAGQDFDSVDGGAGDDVFLVRGVGARDDIIIGGDGFDTVRVNPGAATVVFSRMAWDGVEAFDGSGAALVGTTDGDLLDLSRFASVTGVAAMKGGIGNDTLTGADGADSIAGGTGDDEITGGAGNDTMQGGAGLDRFILRAGFGQDVILDFDARPAGGQDVLMLDYPGVPAVLFQVVGGDTRVTIGADSVLLVGVTGIGANTASMADVVFL